MDACTDSPQIVCQKKILCGDAIEIKAGRLPGAYEVVPRILNFAKGRLRTENHESAGGNSVKSTT
jgi:hypothetical protein